MADEERIYQVKIAGPEPETKFVRQSDMPEVTKDLKQVYQSHSEAPTKPIKPQGQASQS